MHYKNGREAKAGDQIVQVDNGLRSGLVYDLSAQSDTCNGRLAAITSNDPWVSLKDCLHIDDVAAATVPDLTKG